VDALDDLAEDAVLVVEPRRPVERDEELAAVGIRPAVRHRQDPRLAVPQLRAELVREVVARPARTLAEWIAALNHETVDDAVKDGAVVIRLRHGAAAARIGPLLA